MARAKTKTDGEAPGLETRDRAGGKRIPYWIAAKKAVKAGYRPKSVKLSEDASPDDIAAACRRLQSQMQAWLAMADQKDLAAAKVRADGSVAGLIRLYETSPLSVINQPFDPERGTGVKFNTRTFYLGLNKRLYAEVGTRIIRNLTAEDMVNWHANFCTPEYEGGPQSVKRAKDLMDHFVRLVKFGIALKVDGCDDAAKMLTGGGLGSPFRFACGRRRSEELTWAHVLAFHKVAVEHGYRKVGLATIIQFETMMRQADVVGQWWPVQGKTPDGAVVSKGKQWRGLTWGTHLDPDTFELTKPTSKSNGKKVAYAKLDLSPVAQAELALIPREQRIGPVILMEKRGQRRPYKQERFSTVWREIATLAGIPPEVQNRDARAGAINEADNAGVEPGQNSKAATHGKIDMTRSYMRADKVNAEKVLKQRLSARKAG